MEIILQISPQPATLNVSRQMTVTDIDPQGCIQAEARDAKLPAIIRFAPGDPFPWAQFLKKVAVLWELSRSEALPKPFRLKKKLPPEVVENIPKLDDAAALTLFKTLGKLGFLSAFSKLEA
jgi:hypothetical protein